MAESPLLPTCWHCHQPWQKHAFLDPDPIPPYCDGMGGRRYEPAPTERITPDINALWNEVKVCAETGVHIQTGRTLKELSTAEVVCHLQTKASEVYSAMTVRRDQLTVDDVADEFGDTLAVLLHLAYRAHIPLGELLIAARRALSMQVRVEWTRTSTTAARRGCSCHSRHPDWCLTHQSAWPSGHRLCVVAESAPTEVAR